MKLCECGCGVETKVSRNGKPLRFINGHYARTQPHGAGSNNWKGGRTIRNGYVGVLAVGHARANSNGYVREHIAIAETALGRPLPLTAIVHHVNRIENDNSNCNLVICQDQAYHLLLHKRARAYEATGNANALRCSVCKQWGVLGVNDMRLVGTSGGKSGWSYHGACAVVVWAATRRNRRG